MGTRKSSPKERWVKKREKKFLARMKKHSDAFFAIVYCASVIENREGHRARGF